MRIAFSDDGADGGGEDLSFFACLRLYIFGKV